MNILLIIFDQTLFLWNIFVFIIILDITLSLNKYVVFTSLIYFID